MQPLAYASDAPLHTPFDRWPARRSAKRARGRTTPRLLIVPGLHDSGAAHWQSWLQARDAMSFGDVTSDLSLPKILYWAPLVFGIAASAVAAGAMALERGK